MHPQYQKIVDAEWDILYDKLERIHKSGAKVVLSKLPIGDVATQVMNSMTHRIPQHVNRVLIDLFPAVLCRPRHVLRGPRH